MNCKPVWYACILGVATNQPQALRTIRENLCVNGHGVYFAWFVVRGKQIKRSASGRVTRRSPGGGWRKYGEKGIRLHDREQAGIHFEELAKHWPASIKSEVKASTYTRRSVCLKRIRPFFKGMQVRSISLREIEK